jgi:hypothetical protein
MIDVIVGQLLYLYVTPVVENIGYANILVILCVLMDLLFGYSLAFSRELRHVFWSVTKSSSRPHNLAFRARHSTPGSISLTSSIDKDYCFTIS